MGAARDGDMLLNERTQRVGMLSVVDPLEEDGLAVDPPGKLALGVVDEGDAVRHARAEVVAGRSEHRDHAAGHVLAAMVADALDDGRGAAVADPEALASATGGKEVAAGGAIENGVAGDDLRRVERRRSRRPDGDLAAGHSLADVVVGFAFEIEAACRRR